MFLQKVFCSFASDTIYIKKRKPKQWEDWSLSREFRALTNVPFSTSNFVDGKAFIQSASPCVSLGNFPLLPMQPQNRALKTTTTYGRKFSRNVVAMATGEVSSEGTELPEIVKTLQETWDKVEDKYAVSILAVAGVVALWASTGMISAIDRLPLVPGVLELVGIGYTGWFVYKNLVYKPDREALIEKVTDTYKDITGGSSN